MKKIKNLLKIGSFVLITASMNSCATMFIPKNQKVSISAQNTETTVYVNNEKATKGSQKEKVKVHRGGAQVVLSTPNYKDEYIVMKPPKGKRAAAFYPLQILNVPASILCTPFYCWAPWVLDFNMTKVLSYNKNQAFNPTLLQKQRAETEKYVALDGLKYDIKNLKSDFLFIDVEYAKNMTTAIANAEKQIAKAQAKEDKKAAKKKKKETYTEDLNAIKGTDSKISIDMYNALKKTGFVDTVTNIFADVNNTILVEGKVRKINYYKISGLVNPYRKVQVQTMWYVKDLYGQYIDSTLVTSFSGEFTTAYLKKHHNDEFEYTVIKDAIENNFMDFKQTKTFTKYTKIETGTASTDKPFGLTRPTSIVQSMKDAGDATVIVKRKGDKERGHGSGFAITNDGYILTNYHVIAGEVAGKPCEVSVITVTGLEIPAKIVRFNEKTDVALLKVDKKFEKCFALSSKKRYERHDDCYTIGAPVSIELGQSVSNGLISNERETKTGKMLLQLNMNVSPGNSGGAVFSRDGRLHGIVVSKLIGSYAEGVCFAIPTHQVGKYLNIGYKKAN